MFMSWPPSHYPFVVVVADPSRSPQWARRAAPPSLTLRSVSASGTAGERDQHQHPEDVDVGQERRLRLHLLADPGEGLLLRLGERAAVRDEIAASPAAACPDTATLDGITLLDQPALMELLAMRQHVGGERDADRAAGVARRVDQRRGLVGLARAECRRRTRS